MVEAEACFLEKADRLNQINGFHSWLFLDSHEQNPGSIVVEDLAEFLDDQHLFLKVDQLLLQGEALLGRLRRSQR